MAILINVLKEVGKSLLMSLLTEAFLKELLIKILEWLSQKTDNHVDDDLVALVRKALDKPKEENK